MFSIERVFFKKFVKFGQSQKNPVPTRMFSERYGNTWMLPEVRLKPIFLTFKLQFVKKKAKNVQVGAFEFFRSTYARFYVFCMQIIYKFQRLYLGHIWPNSTNFEKNFILWRTCSLFRCKFGGIIKKIKGNATLLVPCRYYFILSLHFCELQYVLFNTISMCSFMHFSISVTV